MRREQPSPPASLSAPGEHHLDLDDEPAEGAVDEAAYRRKLLLGFNASWAVNWFLLGAKIFAFIATHSKAVLASLADSGVDLASQVVIALAEHFMKKKSPDYPVGMARLEALGVIGCACIMSMASLEVLQFSGIDLYNGFAKGQLPELNVGLPMYLILGGGTVFKLLLYFYCRTLQGRSDSMGALAEDHLNDVVSNTGAIVMAAVAGHWRAAWFVDPLGAIVISLWIIWRWVVLTLTQVKKVVGRSAPREFVLRVEELAGQHHGLLTVDCTRAYHFGARFNVEMEIVLPGDMTVSESHDIALDLQHKIEALDEVERAFVHVDYQTRNLPEHKVERTLLLEERRRNERRRRAGAAAARGEELPLPSTFFERANQLSHV